MIQKSEKKRGRLSDERGQALIAALILIPLLIALSSTLLALGFVFTSESRALAACRVSMTESQQEAATALAQLEKLNPWAKSLETSRRTAQAAFRAALLSGAGPLIASTRAALMAAELAQVPVMAQQKYWLVKGKTVSALASQRALSAMNETLPKSRFISKLSIALKPGRFHLVATPTGARTPTYKTALGFEQSQTTKVQSKITLRWSDDSKVETIVPSKISINIGCEMSLVSENSPSTSQQKAGALWSSRLGGSNLRTPQFKPQFREDKLLSN